MVFQPIEYSTWERKEFYEYFADTVVYTTVELDISSFLSGIKQQGIRFYPSLLHCIMQVVNSNAEYRYGHDENRKVGIWDVLHPMYTIPRKDDPRFFSMVITEYRKNFDDFYQAFLQDSARAEVCSKMRPDEIRPDIMGITALPGLHYSSFAFGGSGDKPPDLAPFVIIGGYQEKNNRMIMPITGAFLHSVNDGYHITRFFDLLRDRIEHFTV